MLSLVVKFEFRAGLQSEFTYCAILDEVTDVNMCRKRG